jgi:DNA-binding transcriptional ArsR family regulator
VPEVQEANLDAVFSALADPTRRAILAQLRRGEASVAELAAPFDMTARAVSKHVAVLARAGLVVRGRDAQRRPTQLRVQALAEVDRWLDGYRQLWNGRFDRLNRQVADQLQRKGGRT